MKRAVGTIGNPYKRQDNVETVKVAFRASMPFMGRLKAFTAILEMKGVARNEWLEQVITAAIDAAEAEQVDRTALIEEKREQVQELQEQIDQLRKELAALGDDR